MKLIRLAVLGSALAGALSGRELVANGDFEQPASPAWKWETFGNFADTANCHLWQSCYFDPDLDREVGVHKTLHQWALLSQDVDVPSVNLNFSAAARLFCKTERPDTGYYACACVILQYLDVNDSVLGETRIYARTGGCDWTSSATLHLIPAPDTTRWHNYAFNVADELGNLPGVNPAQVRRVRLGLWSYARNNC
jgi:hypothetical protein